MKIVVLDGYTLNPGDLSWDSLKALGECDIHDRSARDEVLQRAQGAQVILTNKAAVSGETMAQLPDLKYIGVLATGYNIVDVAAARKQAVDVTNVPTYGTRSVAQMTLALLLELTQHVGHHARTVREGRWAASPDFCYWDYPLVELEGLTLGLIGLGRIGRAVGDLARAFGMNVLAHSRSRPPEMPEGFQWMNLEDLLRQSDVVSLHCPLTEETKELMNKERLGLMKQGAFLINTSRGPLIHEAALAEALQAGHLGGAGLDVLGLEPPVKDHPLYQAKNCLITPHIAWATRAARQRLMKVAVQNIVAFQKGAPVNVVNPV